MRRVALLAALAFAAPARATYEPAETAVAALTDLARADLGDACALCKQVDPSTDCSDWGPDRTRSALHYTPIGADASRFHARHMLEAPCFQHDSCCELERTAAGVVQCADPPCSDCGFPTSCAGTDPDRRYALLGYGVSSVGENIAVGYPRALEVFCGWMNSDGHRENILHDYTEMGVGTWSAPAECGAPMWAEVFSTPMRPDPPGFLAAAGGFAGGAPFGGGNGSATVIAFVNGADAAVGPTKVRAVVDGECVDLTRALGAPGKGLYAKSLVLSDGCHDLWFLATDAAGQRHVFPPASSMALAIGQASCPARDTRTLAACEGADACAVEGLRRGCGGSSETDGKGACHGGSQACRAGAFGACEGAVTPVAETCNGLDDDCDGEVDEELADLDRPCATGIPGRCAAGATACRGGTIVCLPTREPGEEICNSEDDDCDGDEDDGLGFATCGTGACWRVVKACATCRPGTPREEICGNGIDDDCDGTPDDGCPCTLAERACYGGPPDTLDEGPCRAGTQRCVAGEWGACEGQRLPAIETCNREDDDCNGAVDDGLGREACGVGACRTSTAACVQGVERACTPGLPRGETCNGEDDDCDGDIDEDCLCPADAEVPCSSAWDRAGVGICRTGRRVCDALAGFSACGGEQRGEPAEACTNGLDDDCNGLVDDGCPPPPPPPEVPAEPRIGCTCADAGATACALVALLARRRRRVDATSRASRERSRNRSSCTG